MTPFDPSIPKTTSSSSQTHADQVESASEGKIREIKDIAAQTIYSPPSIQSAPAPLPKPSAPTNGPTPQNLKFLQNILAKTNTINTAANQNLANRMEIAAAEEKIATLMDQVEQKEAKATQLFAKENQAESTHLKVAVENTDALEVMKVHFSDSTEAMKKTYVLKKYNSEQGTFEAQSAQNTSLKNLEKAERNNQLGSIINNEMYLDPAYALKLGINEGTHLQVKHEDGSTQQVIVRFIPSEYRSKFKSLVNEYIQQRYLQQQMQAMSGNDTQKSTTENTQAPPLINPNKVKDIAPEDSKKATDKKNQGMFLFTLGQLKAERNNIKKNAEKRKEEAVEIRDQSVKKEIESKRVLKEKDGQDSVNYTISSKEAHQKAAKNDTTIHVTPKPSHEPPFRKPSVMRTKIVEGKTEREE